MFQRRSIIILASLLFALWVGVLAAAKYVQSRLNASAIAVEVPTASPAHDDLPILWKSPAFSYIDQDNKPFSEAQLRGHLWIADFIFTQCTTACPVMTARMLMLQHAIADPSVRFVSFSVDPKHDTPAALLAYRSLWQGDVSRWTLLSTTPDGLPKTAAGMKVTVQAQADPVNPILHSSIFVLVDTEGYIRGIYDSIDTAALEQLKADVRRLGGAFSTTAPSVAAGASATPAARGEHLYGEMGCLACHSRPAVAPPLVGLAGSLVRLTDRRTVWADDAYLHESIVDPGAKIVASYLPTMPPYGQTLSPEQVDDLIAYLHTLSSNGEGGHGELLRPSTQPVIELVHDPVCHMSVRADESAPHVAYKGRVYFFCSDDCRDRFVASPSEYLNETHPAKSAAAGNP